MSFVFCSSVQSKFWSTRFHNVRRWIGENGGFVHDALQIHQSTKPPYCSFRVTRDLKIEEMDEPAIIIPNSLIIDRQRALEDLEDTLSTIGCPPLYSKETPELLAVFIAYHKQRGVESIWHPLIECLPEVPPCPWLKSVKELAELEYDQELQELILNERSGNELIVKNLKTLYGDVLGIKLVDLLWAYAQAQSVLLHDKSGSFWTPLMNFVQHDPSYPPLMMYEDSRFVSWSHYQGKPLKMGDYLKMNIGIESPLLLYLSRRIISQNL
eukprot:g7852.t1